MAKTSIIIPALNEGAVISTVVRRLRDCEPLHAAGITDIVVVDNGSTDDTSAQARAAGARVIWEPRRGYGRACLSGVYGSPQSEFIVLMDGDGSDVPEDIIRVWEPVRAGIADLVMGSRTRGQHEPGALTPQQIAGNAVGTALMRLLYGVRLTDIGPLRAIRRETLLRLSMAEMTYGWSAEMLAKAGRLGLRIAEVPVDYRRRAGGQSKVAGTLRGTVKASRSIMSTILRYRNWDAQPEPSAADATPTKRALFIMARLPIEGQTKTRLGQDIGAANATALYRGFLTDLGTRFIAAGRHDGYDVFWCYAAPDAATESEFAAVVPAGGGYKRQGGGTLGDRLWEAFQALHSDGYTMVLVIGSDNPHLPAAWIADAFTALESHDLVVGPTHDGGYYLLGQRDAPVDLFTSITMSTATVCAETLALAQAAEMSIALAPSTFDIDLAPDLDLLRVALEGAPSPGADTAPATLALLRDLQTPRAAVGVGGEVAHD